MNIAKRFRRAGRRIHIIVPVLVLGVVLAASACGGEDSTSTPISSTDSLAQLKPADFPTNPINIIVGYAAGGGSDQWARSIARAAEKTLGVPVTVTNIVGDVGLDAVRDFLSTPADGHTLLSIIDIYAAAFARGEIEVDPAEDLVPLLVGNVAVSQIYIAPDDERYSSWDEVVTYAKENPGLRVPSAGTPLDLEGVSIVSLEQAFDVDLERVFIAETEERFTAPVTGAADILIEQASDVKALVNAGELKPILTLWNEPIKGSKDVPTAKDKGAEFIPLLRLRGLATHRGVPQERIDYLKAALREAFNSEEFQKDLRERSLDLVSYPEDAAAAFREQVETYQQLYETLNSDSSTQPSSSSAPAGRVLVVHSYHEGFKWTRDQGKGIIEGLRRMGYTESQDYELKPFFMDTRVTYTTAEQKRQRGALALNLIEQFQPDIVFVTDDDALKEVAVAYTQRNPDMGLPFVFSGINVDPTIYKPIESLEQPGGPITGALERIPFTAAFSLGKIIAPNASSIVVLADPSPSSTEVVTRFKEEQLEGEAGFPLQVLAVIQPETFDE